MKRAAVLTLALALLALGYGLLGVWLLNTLYRFGQAATCAWQWSGRKWAQVRF